MAADLSDEPETQEPAPGWRPLARQLPAVRPPDLGVPRSRGLAILELCLLPTEPVPPLEAQRLAVLPAELAALGRAFESAREPLRSDSPAAIAAAAGAGLAITRGGDRCGWQPLPQDTVGSVLDEEDIAARSWHQRPV